MMRHFMMSPSIKWCTVNYSLVLSLSRLVVDKHTSQLSTLHNTLHLIRIIICINSKQIVHHTTLLFISLVFMLCYVIIIDILYNISLKLNWSLFNEGMNFSFCVILKILFFYSRELNVLILQIHRWHRFSFMSTGKPMNHECYCWKVISVEL